ncbi:MAG: acyl-CoA thioesterase [Alphaproteobacteria bacterium]|nr:acyl-CoA thioesterase [Alphaproteobacteria bacterium]
MTANPEPDFDPADPASYSFWTEEILRFADLDMVGHVNNNAIGVFIENGRVHMFHDGGENLDKTAEGSGHTWVVRRLEIDFMAEIRFPARVKVGTRVSKVGNTSCTVHQGVFVDGSCRVTAMTIGVCFDPRTRKSTPIPDAVRARMLGHVPKG